MLFGGLQGGRRGTGWGDPLIQVQQGVTGASVTPGYWGTPPSVPAPTYGYGNVHRGVDPTLPTWSYGGYGNAGQNLPHFNTCFGHLGGFQGVESTVSVPQLSQAAPMANIFMPLTVSTMNSAMTAPENPQCDNLTGT